MTWRRHFRVIKGGPQAVQHPLETNRYGGGSGTSANYSSFLPLVYAGHPNRIQRYYQFDDMDKDSDINAALDTIADFCTQSEEQTEELFDFNFMGEPNDSEISILKTMLDKWVRLNDFHARLWYMVRDTLKNGDSFHLRDPETQEWMWLDHYMVEMVKVNEEDGKTPEEYLVRGLDLNRQARYATHKADPNQYRTPFGTSNVGAARVSPIAASGPAAFSLAGTGVDPRQRAMQGQFAQDVQVVDADHVVHLSLSIGNDINWPFGASILEPIFKVYKQKELLEDSIIIYRVQRAPERRIFYIDTGTMPPERAKRHIEAIKNDIHQRRIPNRTGTGGCFELATRVPLLDGRTLSIAEIATEHQAGKQNWAYSCDPTTGEIVPGKITWAGVTRHDAEVIRLTLDNGETIVCTPDHKFPVFGKGKTEAKDIEIGIDSLISFNTRLRSIRDKDDDRHPQYHQIYDHAAKSWRYSHRVVAGFMKELGCHQELGDMEDKCIIHHYDFDKYNNAPDNLFYMNPREHFDLHACMTAKMIEGKTAEELEEWREKIRAGSRTNWRDPAYRERVLAAMKVAMTSDDSIFMAQYRKLNAHPGKGINHLNYAKFSVTTLEKLVKHFGFSGWKEFLRSCGFEVRKPTLGIKTNHALLSAIASLVQAMDNPRLPDVCKALTADPDFMRLFTSLNRETNGMSNKDKISINTLKSIIAKHGYMTWTDFRANLHCFNHKVVAIEQLDRRDVGTITIDGNEEYHAFHTFALEQGVFAFNSILDAAYNPLSINDDYFFAQSADGRGSKVETLPGGELTGEIGDLMFFTRKMARGLRVPTSYLNLGEEDGSNANVSFNDGKLGAALIQEHRFSKFCMRLQSLLAPVFDFEFKRYLVKNGIEIEPGLFRLMFTPPQSFTRYRQLELDSQRTQVYGAVAENKILSHRFKLKRYLGLNDDEILENEKLWAEENANKLKQKTGASPAEAETSGAGLSDVGLHPGGDMDMGMDMPPEEGEAGAGAMPGTPGATPPGGEAAAPAAAGAAPAGGAMPPG